MYQLPQNLRPGLPLPGPTAFGREFSQGGWCTHSAITAALGLLLSVVTVGLFDCCLALFLILFRKIIIEWGSKSHGGY
jgi:hypothetical protein